jgi:ElaB/YqjD/DUF883 family membrane-anchored ribosome-binding protein
MNPPAKVLHQVLDELRPVVTDVEKLLSGPVTDTSREVIEALSDRLQAVRDRLEVTCAHARKQVSAGVRSVDHAVHEHPYQFLAAAAALGLLAGVLLGRRNR